MMRSGRAVNPKTHYDLATTALTQAWFGYQSNLRERERLDFSEEEHTIHHEFTGIRSGLGGGFVNTHKLKAMNYNEAMVTNKEVWDKGVEE